MDGKKMLKRIPIGLLIIAAGFLPIALGRFVEWDLELLSIAAPIAGLSGGILYVLAGLGAALTLSAFIFCIFIFGDQGLGALVFYGAVIIVGSLISWLNRKKMIKTIQAENPAMNNEDAAEALDALNQALSNPHLLMEEYETGCLAKNTCHLCRKSKFYQVFCEEDSIYFCVSGYVAEEPFKMDDDSLTAEQRLVTDKGNFKLKRSQIHSVVIKETFPKQPNGHRQLKLAFHTDGKDQVFYDAGLTDPSALEHLLRSQFHLFVEAPQYSPVSASFQKNREKEKKKPHMSFLGGLAFLSSLWLLFYPHPLKLALGANLLIAAILFLLDWKKDTDSGDSFVMLEAVFGLFELIFISAAHEAGILSSPLLLLYFLPLPILWLVLVGIVFIFRWKKSDNWKKRVAQAAFCAAYAGALMIWLI